MGSKLVILDAVIELETGNGTGTFTDVSDHFTEATVEVPRDDLDSGVFGDRAARHEKGIFQNQISLQIKPDADFVTLADFADFLISDLTRLIKIKFKNEVVSATNQQFVGNVHCTNIPFGGARNTIQEGSITWPIDGALELWEDATGTTKKTFG